MGCNYLFLMRLPPISPGLRASIYLLQLELFFLQMYFGHAFGRADILDLVQRAPITGCPHLHFICRVISWNEVCERLC